MYVIFTTMLLTLVPAPLNSGIAIMATLSRSLAHSCRALETPILCPYTATNHRENCLNNVFFLPGPLLVESKLFA